MNVFTAAELHAIGLLILNGMDDETPAGMRNKLNMLAKQLRNNEPGDSITLWCVAG